MTKCIHYSCDNIDKLIIKNKLEFHSGKIYNFLESNYSKVWISEFNDNSTNPMSLIKAYEVRNDKFDKFISVLILQNS